MARKPKYEPLTKDSLREFDGFENMTDAQAEEIADQINYFASIVVRVPLDDIKPYAEAIKELKNTKSKK